MMAGTEGTIEHMLVLNKDSILAMRSRTGILYNAEKVFRGADSSSHMKGNARKRVR